MYIQCLKKNTDYYGLHYIDEFLPLTSALKQLVLCDLLERRGWLKNVLLKFVFDIKDGWLWPWPQLGSCVDTALHKEKFVFWFCYHRYLPNGTRPRKCLMLCMLMISVTGIRHVD